jgi:glycosyltransferase involved in cell wall biosynthesis
MSTYSRNHADKNCPCLLRRALDSILGQTFRDFELILVDDGSIDGSKEVCREYEKRDPRIRLYRFENNSGLPAKRYNDGLRLAQANYFTFMFDDDTWFPNAIQDLYEAITTTYKHCGMVYGLANTVNSLSGAVTKNFGGDWSLEAIHKNNFFCNFTTIVKREAIDAVGGYDEDPLFRRLCDWDLWVRIGEKFPVARINKLIGIWNYALPDSIGMTVPMSDSDKQQMYVTQKTERDIRLQGIMSRRLRFCFAHSSTDAALLRWAIGYLSDALKQDGIDAEVVNTATPAGREACDTADAVLFYRTIDQESLDFIRRMKLRGKFVLYAIDDYIFQPNCKYASGKLVKSFFDEANAIVSPSSKLLEKITIDKPKIHRRNVLDQETLDLLNPIQFVSSAPNCYAIGWLAGIGRKEMNGFVKLTLRCLDKRLGDGEAAIFICFGGHSLGSFEKIRVVEQPYFRSDKWKELYQAYRSFAFSVVINPLDESDEFCHCKSSLKFVETGAMMVPLVTSRVHPFTEVIHEGENGFFASTPDEFASKALEVCRNSALAKKVALAAQKQVQDEYNSVCNARRFMADVLTVMSYQEKERLDEVSQSSEKLNALLKNLEEFDSEVVGPVIYGSQLEMSIPLLPTCTVGGISVLGATYCRVAKKGAAFQIWVNGTKVREGGLSPETMADNAWWKISFPPFEVSIGDTLTLRLSNRDAEVKLGFYTCRDQFVGRAKIKAAKVRPIAIKLEARTD